MNNEADLKVIDENYDAVFIGTGLGETTKLGIPGEDKENVFGATEFIEVLRKDHSDTKVGEIVFFKRTGKVLPDVFPCKSDKTTLRKLPVIDHIRT